ncbi:hypothetical protein ACF0H5_017606 [Mactra antiquata]
MCSLSADNGTKWCRIVCFQALKRTATSGIIFGKCKCLKCQLEVKESKHCSSGHFAPPRGCHGNWVSGSNGYFLKTFSRKNMAKLYIRHSNSDEIRASSNSTTALSWNKGYFLSK